MVSRLRSIPFLHTYFFSRTELGRSVILFCLFLSAMLIFRLFYTGKPMFFFLPWNLFLGYLPLHLSTFLLKRPESANSRIRFGVLLLAWLLLIPNSFYIVTDLFHLKLREPIPLWFDLSLIFSFSWLGLLFGVLSLRQIELVIARRWGSMNRLFFILPTMFLISLGIYIGRFLRYNSWDVITDPFALARDIIYLVIHPVRNRFDISMIVCFAVLFTLFYFTVGVARTPSSVKSQGSRLIPKVVRPEA